LAIQGIQLEADKDVTPQLIFLSDLSCARLGLALSKTKNSPMVSIRFLFRSFLVMLALLSLSCSQSSILGSPLLAHAYCLILLPQELRDGFFL
jgi:hypothetical protein